MTTDHPTRSEIFSVYNLARTAARRGRQPSGLVLEVRRVNRALGLLLSGRERPYATTAQSCNCPDAQRGNVCKHRVAAMMAVRIRQRRQIGAI